MDYKTDKYQQWSSSLKYSKYQQCSAIKFQLSPFNYYGLNIPKSHFHSICNLDWWMLKWCSLNPCWDLVQKSLKILLVGLSLWMDWLDWNFLSPTKSDSDFCRKMLKFSKLAQNCQIFTNSTLFSSERNDLSEQLIFVVLNKPIKLCFFNFQHKNVNSW